MSRLRILVLTKYGRLGASSRLRLLQYVPILSGSNIAVESYALLSDEVLKSRYASGRFDLGDLIKAYLGRVKLLLHREKFDLIWIEKEALPFWPVSIELMLLSGVPYVLDYDDAIFHNYDMHSKWIVRKLLGSRLDRMMEKAALITAGNRYLAKRALDADAQWVESVPTVIDLDRYPVGRLNQAFDVPRIVWIGSPSTARYLYLLCEALRRLALKTPFVLRIVGAQGVEIPGIELEYITWTESTEVDSISSCSVGIMPLEDSPWEKGKCGYKLIQYMACSLPVVASAIGANVEIVENGKTGYLASSDDEWVTALRTLLESPQLRREMGEAGRARVEEKYCLQKTGPRMVELLRTASKK